MSNTFFVRAKFFFGIFRAAGDEHGHRREWPPAPYRLYCALVSAYYCRMRATGEHHGKDLLEWLADVRPTIYAKPMPKEDGLYCSYVPNSIFRDKKDMVEHAAMIHKVLRRHPFVSLDEVYYGFSHVPYRDCFEDLLRWVPYLGRGESSVRLSAEAPTGEYCVWQPSEKGNVYLRCPFPGVLSALDERYKHGTKVVARSVLYQQSALLDVDEGKMVKPKQKPRWHSHYIRAISAPCHLNIFQVYRVAKSVRTALAQMARQERCSELEHEIRSHEHTEHLSFLPLIEVRSTFPSGTIHGIMVCPPVRLAHLQLELEQCLSQLTTAPFYVYGKHHCDLTIGRPSQLRTLDPKRWVAPSKNWETATPVEMPFFHKKQERERDAWIQQACLWAGLPCPEKIEMLPMSAWGDGSHAAVEFVKVEKHTSQPKPHGYFTHLRLRFPIPVRGPIALGFAQNYGGGLMFPAEDASTGGVKSASTPVADEIPVTSRLT